MTCRQSFEEAKGREAEEEAPKVDAPSLLPGWGAWAGQQRSPWLDGPRPRTRRRGAAISPWNHLHGLVSFANLVNMNTRSY